MPSEPNQPNQPNDPNDPNDHGGVVHIGWAREDRAHDELLETLARRVVVEGASWPIADTLEHMWSWAGPAGEKNFRISGNVEVVGPGGRRLRLHGKIAGQPLAPEASMYRRLLHAFDQSTPRPALVILARDGDGAARARRRGFTQVTEHLSWPFAVILAMPEPESEAWFVCGFEPNSDTERALHARLCARLSFDPVTEPHRLTSKPNDAPTDAKRVLDVLCADPTRRAACLAIPLHVLAQRGERAGLANLLAELREHLVPLLDPRPR